MPETTKTDQTESGIITTTPVDRLPVIITDGDDGRKKVTFQRADSALDALMEEKEREAAAGGDDEAAKKAAEEKAAADKAAAEKAAADEAAAKAGEKGAAAEGGAAGAPPAKTDEEKVAEAKAAEEKAAAEAAAKAAEQLVDPEFVKKVEEVKLPAHSRPASAEAFARVKEMSRQEIERLAKRAKELEATLEATKKAAEEAAAKLAQAPPPELAKEVEELRAFRATVDVSSAPPIKEVETKISANEEKVFALLREQGMDEAGIKQIKEEHGGVSKVNWTVILSKLGDTPAAEDLKALVSEARNLGRERSAVEAKVRANASEFLKAQQEQASKQTAQLTEVRTKSAEDLLGKIPMARTVDPATVKPEQKAEVEAQNALAKKLRDRVAAGIADTSPNMHATLAVGSAMAFVYAEQVDALTKQITEIEAKHTAALAALQKKHDEVAGQLEKIRKASRGSAIDDPTRKARATKPSGGEYQFGVRGNAALDQLAEQVAAERNA